MKFSKYHALGNDYIVLDPQELDRGLSQEMIRQICHRHYGAGADGILLGPFENEACDFGLRIFNPDGSEAEKSGNGLRIFARYLVDEGYTAGRPLPREFTVETQGGAVACMVSPDGRSVKVDLGRVSFNSADIPVSGPVREVLNETMEVNGDILTFCAATIGNPHCVVLLDQPTAETAWQYGPAIERDKRFAEHVNVQFMQVLDRANIKIEIWERGAGYTLASGSSSAAAAAVAHKLGLCGVDILVHMPGGQLAVQLDENFAVSQTGPVSKICSGVLAAELLEPAYPQQGAWD
jgi:diaminopimelate epimerase